MSYSSLIGQDFFKIMATPEGQKIFQEELTKEINREIIEMIKVATAPPAVQVNKPKAAEQKINPIEIDSASTITTGQISEVKAEPNPEMVVGDYVVLYEVNPAGDGIFVPIIYQITGFSFIENTKHIYTVKLQPLKTVGPGSFDDHEVTVTLDRIAFYHNQEVFCLELLEDHRRWVVGKRVELRKIRLVELNLLAKCKREKCNF